MYLGRPVEHGAEGSDVRDAAASVHAGAAGGDAVGRSGGTGSAPRVVRGELPSPLNPPPGCAFATRCPYATDALHRSGAGIARRSTDIVVACHHAEAIGMELAA